MSRSSGILLHISSLYSNHGIGTLGLPAYDFASFLHKSGQHYWQMLPIGPTGFGDSPYMSYSSFAGNPYFIDLDTLAYQGYLTYDEIQACNFGNNPDQVDFAQLHEERIPLLRKAYARIRPETVPELDAFCEEQKSWLDDYCLYMALREDQGTIPWYQWDQPYKMREPSALQEARVRLHGEIRFHAFLQYLFYLQWEQLRFYLKELKIRLIGDLPIYVPLDSADVWANPEIFQLDEKDHRPEAVSGVPPDYFSEDGQLWGHPLYDWDALKKTGYSWWINRIRHQASLFDATRIDHFRALASYWRIPIEATSAKCGKWVEGPGIDFVNAVNRAFPDFEIIAEDLGILTEDVYKLREASGWPGMAVLEFAFSRGANSVYLPHNHVRNSVLYVGTHDNMTAVQWLEQNNDDVAYMQEYLGGRDVDTLLRAGMRSVSDLFISTMQDWLHLGAWARMNEPSTIDINWKWRMRQGVLNDGLAAYIRGMTQTYCR